MKKRMIIMLTLCALVLGGVFGFKLFASHMMMQAMSAMKDPAQTVSTAKAGTEEWLPETKVVGTFRAINGADLSPEAQGVVESVHFESGQNVAKGAVLLKLRNADESSRLTALMASAKLAQQTMDRDAKMIESKAISQATFDADQANLDSLKAQVAAQKATLEKKFVIAPFAGHLGIRQVDIGQFINPGAPVVSLQQIDPIYVDFTVPQQAFPQVKEGQKIAVRTDVYPGKTFKGTILALDSKIDESTRNVSVRALVKNPEKTLRPGVFASVTIVTGSAQKFLTLPQTAITFNPYGSTVYVVDEKGANDKGEKQFVARMVFVKTGATRGDQIAVLDGLKDGDEVVTSGQIKLRNGSRVVVNNTVTPSSDPDPKPEDQ